MKAYIDVKELIRVIKALKPFTRKADQYCRDFKMECIHVKINSDTQEARFEALDGHRIAVEHVKCSTEESFSAYIKPFTPWKTEALQAELELIEKVATLDMGHYSVKFIQPEGEWYDTKKKIGETEQITPSSKIGINPQFMIEALKDINTHACSKAVVIETRGKKEPVIVRELKDRRNMRIILPINISSDED